MAIQPQRVFLLPERRRFAGQSPGIRFGKRFARMVESLGVPGETAQLQRHFQCLPSPWAMAALCRQAEFGDASDGLWMRADPIHLRIEMRGARVMAWDTLQISEQDSLAMFNALRPVFGDAGYVLSQGVGGGFYIKIARGTPVPEFTPAPEILGSDLYAILPDDRKWTALFNECQIILHNHPVNDNRMLQGLMPVNGLWFWGPGALPQKLRHPYGEIASNAWDLKALAAFPVDEVDVDDARAARVLVDCRQMRHWPEIEALLPFHESFRLDFSDGAAWDWKPPFKWYFWRRNSFDFS